MSCNRLQLVLDYKYCIFSLLAQTLFFLILLDGVLHFQNFKSSYLSRFLSKSLQAKFKFHLFQFSTNPTNQNLQKQSQMEEPSKKRNGSSSTTTAARQRRHNTSDDPPAPPNLSFSSPRSLTLFSSDEQHQRYYSLFSNRVILDAKYLDIEFFDGENFDCYQVFQNSELIDFMSLKLSFYLKLVRVFYNNLQIRDGVIFSEVHKIPIVVDQSLFYSLTKLSSQGVPFEGTLVNDWKHIYSSHDARKMVCNDHADMTGRLPGSFTFECRIMHYIICRVLLPRSTNLAQVPYKSADEWLLGGTEVPMNRVGV